MADPARETYRTQAYRRLLELLAEGEISPGQKWSEQRVATLLGVPSRTPGLREALAMLDADGFIDQRPQVGFVVWPVTQDEATELQRLRIGAESSALLALLASPACSTAVEAANNTLVLMEKAAVNDDPREFARHEAALHIDLARAAGFNSGVRVLERWFVRLRMFWTGTAQLRSHDMSDSVEEHRTILAAIEKGDSRYLFGVLEDHLERSIQRIRNAPLQAESGGVSAVASTRSEAALSL